MNNPLLDERADLLRCFEKITIKRKINFDTENINPSLIELLELTKQHKADLEEQLKIADKILLVDIQLIIFFYNRENYNTCAYFKNCKKKFVEERKVLSFIIHVHEQAIMELEIQIQPMDVDG